MAPVFLPDLMLNARISGPEGAPPVVLLHALGTNLTVWDGVVARLPRHRTLAIDMRGHGASSVPQAPYAMGALIHDAERVMEHFSLREAVVVGLSIGGLIAQGLATKRLDLVRGMVLSNTAARIGHAAQWHARIEAVRAGGMQAIADTTMERWFGRNWGRAPALPQARALLLGTAPEGWAGAAAALAGTDFYTPTAGLTLPTLGIAGARDGSTPPDLVRETTDLIRGSRFMLMHNAGHLPMLDDPDLYARHLNDFLESIGHV